MPSNLTWYVVQTKPRSEWLAWGTLEMLGYEVFYPRHRKLARHARREEMRTIPHFSGYIFVGIQDGQGLYDVNNCQGVRSVLYMGIAKPYVVPQRRMSELLALGQEDEQGRPGLISTDDGEPEPKRSAEYSEGAELVLTRGPFVGFPAVVVVDEGRLIRVKLNVFGRESEAVVSPDDVTSASPDRAARPAPSAQASA